MMKHIIFAITLTVLLAGCGTPSVEDLVEDPEMMLEISQECQMLTMQGKDTNTEECNNAKKAAAQMAKNMMKGLGSDIKNTMQGGFGR